MDTVLSGTSEFFTGGKLLGGVDPIPSSLRGVSTPLLSVPDGRYPPRDDTVRQAARQAAVDRPYYAIGPERDKGGVYQLADHLGRLEGLTARTRSVEHYSPIPDCESGVAETGLLSAVAFSPLSSGLSSV